MKTLNTFLGRMLVSMIVACVVAELLSPTHPTLSTIVLPVLTAILAQYLMDFLTSVDKGSTSVVAYEERQTPGAK